MKTFKTGGVSWCCHCNRQLWRKKGGFVYIEVVDKGGVTRRLHKGCAQAALDSGYYTRTGSTYKT